MPNLSEVCRICKIEKPLDEYALSGYVNLKGEKLKRKECKTCCNLRRAQYFKIPEKRDRINERRRLTYKTDGGQRRSINRRYALQNTYGLTEEQVDSMLIEQEYSCKICGLYEGDAPKCRLYVEHNHVTGKVRGMVCQNCNNALGHVKESIDTLYAMIEYLTIQG